MKERFICFSFLVFLRKMGSVYGIYGSYEDYGELQLNKRFILGDTISFSEIDEGDEIHSNSLENRLEDFVRKAREVESYCKKMREIDPKLAKREIDV